MMPVISYSLNGPLNVLKFMHIHIEINFWWTSFIKLGNPAFKVYFLGI